MEFEYQQVQTAQATIEIEDIGNCCILARSLIGEERYLYIKTGVGCTQIITYGPIVPDIEQLPMEVRYVYNRFDFNEAKIIRTIEKFLADADQAEETDIDKVREFIKPMIDNMEVYE